MFLLTSSSRCGGLRRCLFSTRGFSAAIREQEAVGFSGLFRLLKPEERAILEDQKQLTESARAVAQKVGVLRAANRNAFLSEHSTFSVVITGEYNAGKSTLINALLGQKLLDTGSLPTTNAITILTSDEAAATDLPTGVVQHALDLPLFQDLTLVDTPGTNAVVADHTNMTLRLLPNADLILFCTSADRPFPESERTLLESIAAYRKNIIIVINKMDVLEDSGGVHGAREKQRVTDFVVEHASALLGAQPIVLSVSSRDALSSKLTGSTRTSNVWKRSNFASLESFLQETLTTEAKIKSKLASPIGVAENLLEECVHKLSEDKTSLETDIATLNLLQSQFAAWRKELESDMARSNAEIKSSLKKEGARASVLLRRMGHLDSYTWCLFDQQRLQKEWDKTKPSFSSQTLRQELVAKVKETADSIATRGRAQGQAAVEFLGKRPAAATQSQSLVGSVTAASRFEDTRRLLSDSMTKAVERSVDADEGITGDLFLGGLRRAAFASAMLNAASLGSAVAAGVQLIDVSSGIASASAAVISGALILSLGQKQAARQYADVYQKQSQHLDEDMEAISSREVDRLERRIRDGTTPYTRFVETEQDRIEQQLGQSEELLASAQRLRKRITR